ncbi:RNA ligase family protein [Micromonospora sp. NPDC049101]|uniref:RNA ligase family protein n=1 Tax=Micromonospora sp. NPDC049101 TaxID=3155032 RepID=UPI0033C7E45A
MSDFPSFPKIPRLHRQAVITEKVDGTNGLIDIERVAFGTGVDNPPGVYTVGDYESPLGEDGMPRHEFRIRAGSRNRWLAPGADNHGFSAWVDAHAVELSKLGPGRHYGEWWGKGIQRGYGAPDKAFALFNVARWFDGSLEDGEEYRKVFPKAGPCPEVVTTVPVLWHGNANVITHAVQTALTTLTRFGSVLAPGFMQPEGLMVYHVAGGHYYKVLIDGDAHPKGVAA